MRSRGEGREWEWKGEERETKGVPWGEGGRRKDGEQRWGCLLETNKLLDTKSPPRR